MGHPPHFIVLSNLISGILRLCRSQLILNLRLRPTRQWGKLSGAFAGGAAAGETLLYTFNPALAGTVGGAAGNLAKQGINNLTGAQHGFDSGDFLIDTSSGFVTGLIPDGGTALKGIAGKLEKGLPGAMGAGLLDAAKRIICN